MKAIFFILIFCTINCLFAQPVDSPLAGQEDMVLENERIFEIIRSHKSSIPYPVRVVEVPDMSDIKYTSQEFRFSSKPQAPDIQPLAYKETPSNTPPLPIYSRYLKVGLGQYLTPMLRLHLANPAKSKWEYGLDFTHLSAHYDKIILRQFRQDNATFSIGKSIQHARWSLNLYGNNHSYFQYAGHTALTERNSPVADSLSRMYSNADALLHFSSLFDTEKNFHYDISFGTKNVIEKKQLPFTSGNRESQIIFTPDLRLALGKQMSIGAVSDFNYVNANMRDASENRIFMTSTPYLQFHKNNVSVKGGLFVGYYNEFESKTQRFALSPVGEIRYMAIPSILSVYAGYGANMKNNTYYNILKNAHYSSGFVNTFATAERMNIYLGTNANIASKIDLSAQVYYKKITDQQVFYATETQTLTTAYLPKLTVIGTHLEANYNMNKNFRLGAAFDYNHYDTTATFSLPVMQARIFSDIKFMTGRLNIHPELYLYGQTAVYYIGNIIGNRSPKADMNLEIDYRLNERFSLFAAGNNLFGANYYRYYGFPERKYNFMGGLTWAF